MSLLLQFDFEELLWSVLECYLHSLWRYINPVNLNLYLIFICRIISNVGFSDFIVFLVFKKKGVHTKIVFQWEVSIKLQRLWGIAIANQWRWRLSWIKHPLRGFFLKRCTRVLCGQLSWKFQLFTFFQVDMILANAPGLLEHFWCRFVADVLASYWRHAINNYHADFDNCDWLLPHKHVETY